MKRLFVRVLPAIVLICVVAPLVAQQRQPGQRFGGGQGIGALLNNKSVQEELKVTDDQKASLTSSLKDLRDKYKDSFTGKDREKLQEAMKEMRAETNKITEKVLKPEQVKRLHQIELQVAVQMGTPEVLNQERVQKALSYSDKQKDMIKETTEMLAKERREMLGGGGQRPDQEKMQAFRKKAQAATEKIVDSLSADQKKSWKELTGAKFDYKPEMGRRPPQQ